jgi:hypothetical protein
VSSQAEPKTKRPTHYSKEVIEQSALKILPEVMAWIKDADADDVSSEQDVLFYLIKAVRGNHDAYDFARNLERYHLSPNFDLCEILNNFSTYSAHTELVKQWVAAEGVTLALAVGQEVETARGRGRITELRHETAQYIVTPPDDQKFKNGGGGWIIDAEDVVPVTA